MKRTLVERVAQWLCNNYGLGSLDTSAGKIWRRKARRIIAMVRRNDRKEKGR